LSPSHPTPRPLTIPEIKSYVQWYANAADKAINQAGFDGVELHFANGYLPDQFIQDVSNQRSDEYGGSIENRLRFPLEILDAVTKSVGQDRVAFRISPWSDWQGMRMQDPKPTFTHLVSKVKESYRDLAYLHLIEPSVPEESNDFLRKIWGDKPFISTGGHSPESAEAVVTNSKGGLVGFGRHYLANVGHFFFCYRFLRIDVVK